MIIPAIGEVPNWLIAYSVVAAIIVIYLVKRFLSSRVRNFEMYIDAALLDIKDFFIWLSKLVRRIQVDTINTDTTILIFGVVLVLLIYLVVIIW